MKFIITIDTEGDNQWDGGRPESAENIRFIPRFQQLCDRYGFPPTYLCTYDVVEHPAFDEVLLPLAASGRAEIGAHLHPWTTPPFTRWDRSDRAAAYPSELPVGVFARKLETLTRRIEEKTGRAPRSYRAGRWGLSAAHVPVLLQLGYTVDCSVTPHVDWRDPGARERGQDFSSAPVAPYFMSWGDPARAGASGLLEVPVTIVYTNRLMRRSPFVRDLYLGYRKTVVARGLNRAFLLAPRWFRPFSDMSVSRFRAVYKAARDMGLPAVEMMFHSSELMPNGSPHNLTEGAVEDLFERLTGSFTFLADEGLTGTSLGDFAADVARGRVDQPEAAPLACSVDELTWAPREH
jgi:hypothetical protein